MSLIKDRVRKAKEIEGEINRLKSLQTKRTKYLGVESANIQQQIRRLENTRRVLPPRRNIQAVGNDVAFWAGGTFEGAIFTMMNPDEMNPAAGQEQANFVVTHGGTLIANQAIIRGNIFAEDGVFSGTIYASAGEIGGWTIGEDRLQGINDSQQQRIFLYSGGYLGVNGASEKLRMSVGSIVNYGDPFTRDAGINWWDGGYQTSYLTDKGYLTSGGAYNASCFIGQGLIQVRFGAFITGNRVSLNIRAISTADSGVLKINIEGLPRNRNDVQIGEVYLDGENLKVRTS